MVEVQCLEKDDTVQTCDQLADVFTRKLFGKYKCDIFHVNFDSYNVENSLKSSTRKRRQGGKEPTAYRISGNMNIRNITMKKLLSHVATKHELTCFFSQKIIKYSERHELSVVVLYASKCESSFKDVSHLWNNHEEAETKMILSAKDATDSGASHALKSIHPILMSLSLPSADILICVETLSLSQGKVRTLGTFLWNQFTIH